MPVKVLFASIRNPSHFMPLVPFIRACQNRGHGVAVAAPADLAERVAATGATFFPFGHPGDAGLKPYWQRLRQVSGDEHARVAIGGIFAGACAAAALPAMLETLGSWRPTIVVRESQEYASLVAAEKMGIPCVRVAISARGAEQSTMRFAVEEVDVRRRSLDLPADPEGARIRSEDALTLFPPSFEGPEAESSPARTLRFRARREAAAPLPPWWGERGEPFVYLTLGTVIGNIAEHHAAYRATLDAVADLPVRALLTTGAELPHETLGTVPANVHVERFVPQDQVLPHAAAVVFHGGSGTVQGALAAGVPMVVAPMFADQQFNAGCVAAAGAGLALPEGMPDPAALRAALVRVLAEPSFRTAAQRFAREIATLPLVDEAGAELERLAASSR